MSTRALWPLVLLFASVGCKRPEPAAAPGPAASAATVAPTPTPTSSPADARATAPMNDTKPADDSTPQASGRAVATFGGGCFWCTEAVLETLDGVLDVTSGYMGGRIDDPTYEQVCSGTTGHAEVVQVTFDPSRISYEALLDWFFRSHDPTTRNRQGADVGTQYRSVVFTHDEQQAQEVRAKVQELSPSYAVPIVTEITAASRFWPAETYHQDYFRTNPNAGYCRAVIAPKLKKLGIDGK